MPWAINIKSLDAVVATGAGGDVDTLGGRPLSMITIASDVTSGAVLKMEGSCEGTNWVELTTRNISANGTYVDSVDYPIKLVRGNVSSRTDGTYTVYLTVPAASAGWQE